jgi:hypothetical protein
MNLRSIALIFLALAWLSGCEDRFRYPCMDKANWKKQECQRPDCAITGTCPDQLLKAEDMNEKPSP